MGTPSRNRIMFWMIAKAGMSLDSFCNHASKQTYEGKVEHLEQPFWNLAANYLPTVILIVTGFVGTDVIIESNK